MAVAEHQRVHATAVRRAARERLLSVGFQQAVHKAAGAGHPALCAGRHLGQIPCAHPDRHAQDYCRAEIPVHQGRYEQTAGRGNMTFSPRTDYSTIKC